MQKQINSLLSNKIMYITYKNYKLKVSDYSFDLIEEYEARKIGDGTLQNPTGEIYVGENVLGYGCSLDTCVKKIIHNEMKKQNRDISLKEFLEEYRSMVKELEDHLKTK